VDSPCIVFIERQSISSTTRNSPFDDKTSSSLKTLIFRRLNESLPFCVGNGDSCVCTTSGPRQWAPPAIPGVLGRRRLSLVVRGNPARNFPITRRSIRRSVGSADVAAGVSDSWLSFLLRTSFHPHGTLYSARLHPAFPWSGPEAAAHC